MLSRSQKANRHPEGSFMKTEREENPQSSFCSSSDDENMRLHLSEFHKSRYSNGVLQGFHTKTNKHRARKLSFYIFYHLHHCNALTFQAFNKQTSAGTTRSCAVLTKTSQTEYIPPFVGFFLGIHIESAESVRSTRLRPASSVQTVLSEIY